MKTTYIKYFIILYCCIWVNINFSSPCKDLESLIESKNFEQKACQENKITPTFLNTQKKQPLQVITKEKENKDKAHSEIITTITTLTGTLVIGFGLGVCLGKLKDYCS